MLGRAQASTHEVMRLARGRNRFKQEGESNAYSDNVTDCSHHCVRSAGSWWHGWCDGDDTRRVHGERLWEWDDAWKAWVSRDDGWPVQPWEYDGRIPAKSCPAGNTGHRCSPIEHPELRVPACEHAGARRHNRHMDEPGQCTAFRDVQEWYEG